MTRQSHYRQVLYWCASIAVFLVPATLCLPGGLELDITRVKGGSPILVLPLDPGETFTIHYVHSVENAPIWEMHSLDDNGNLFIEEERFVTFGAGMGRMQGVGRLVRRGGYEVIENMHMPTGNFVLRVGSPGVDHTIWWRGIGTNLSKKFPHEAVRFSGRPVSLLYKLLRLGVPHPATPKIGKR